MTTAKLDDRSSPALPTLHVAGGYEVADLGHWLAGRTAMLPYSLRVVLENTIRNSDGDERQIMEIAGWVPGADPLNVTLKADRIILPDSSGLPVLMDFAALREALVREGRDPALVEPSIPCDLVVDHSLIVDEYGHADAAKVNLKREYERNSERYRFFKWAQSSFSKIRIVPPGMGIVHQVHLEYLARVFEVRDGLAFPEFVLGCDSHTPMVNALGVLGWGVGGIDAEAALIGERYGVRIPRVVGVRLSGRLRPGVTTTDLVLTLTEALRQVGVVGDFVEFCGRALDALEVAERATLANMAPEYGATCAYFPIDNQTIRYLEQTGRAPEHVAMVAAAARASGLFREAGAPEPSFSELVELDLGTVEASVAGPRRPQDRVPLNCVPGSFLEMLPRPRAEGGFDATPHPDHGLIAIAAITACTNTSNPRLMLGAGILARNAVARGLAPPSHVKTSLAPGSRVVTDYLEKSGLMEPLESLGFFTVGFGCTTCSGKSGPIAPDLEHRADRESLVLAAVLSGNRNFEGRIHKSVRANYITSPLLVVAYALAGRIDFDFAETPLGTGEDGKPVMLNDIWPDAEEIEGYLGGAVNPSAYRANYDRVFAGTTEWRSLDAQSKPLFSWDEASTYIRRPPFFDPHFLRQRTRLPNRLEGARTLVLAGDSLTTDHITPSGEIGAETLAGQYLLASGVPVSAFNAYTQRRGNHEVLLRATFANPRMANLLVAEQEGGVTRLFPGDEIMPVFDAAARYRESGVPMIVIAGKDYGMGSSRDWAAKGPALLGVSMVIAQSFERIHRANLIGVGIIPAVFAKGANAATLGLAGDEHFTMEGLHAAIENGAPITARARRADGTVVSFPIEVALYGEDERRLMRSGGLFPAIFNRLLSSSDLRENAGAL